MLLTLNLQLMIILTRYLLHVRINFLTHGTSTVSDISRVSTFLNIKNTCIVHIDKIIKDLVDIGNISLIIRCGEAIFKFKEKYKLQTEFLKVFQAEYLEPRNRDWCGGLLYPGVARSNNGMESHFKYFKKEACPDVRQVYDFLT